MRILAVADIKAGNSACFDMKEGSYTLFTNKADRTFITSKKCRVAWLFAV